MPKAWSRTNRPAFSLVEIILASALFGLLVTALAGAYLLGQETTALAGSRARAGLLAEEGLEATRNIRDAGWANLIDGAHGLAVAGNQWTFSGTQDTSDIFTRQLSIATVDAKRKTITSQVTWQQNQQRAGAVTLTTRLTNWLAATGRGGMLIFANGGTTSDALQYRLFDGVSRAWSGAGPTADVDAGSVNRAPRLIRVYASKTRNEKILISRHYNGTTQYIYGQVWNGTTWGNVQLLSSWNAVTFLDVQNVDGTYLNNGNFMVVFSDNSVIPKSRIWNGTTWQAQASLTTLGATEIPNVIVAKARPGTQEVMAAFFTQASDTLTQYFNGTTWSAVTSHAATAPVNTKRLMDFDWSPNNPLIGGLVFSNSANDRVLHIKIWTANGSGSGAWSAVADTANQGASGTRLGAMMITGRPGVNQFIACNDNTATQVICYQSTFTPTWSNPVNQILTATTDGGLQRTFDAAYETVAGTPAINVYSDGTTTPKLKKYNPATSTWDAAATNLMTLAGTLRSVKLYPAPDSNDIMTLFADANVDLYSNLWDGTAQAMNSPTVGNPNVETDLDTNLVGQAEAFQTTASATKTLTTISLYLDPASTSTNITVGLYTNSGSNPGTLLTQASSTTLVNGAWNTIAIPPVAVTSGTNYWIAILSTAGVPRFRDRLAGPCTSINSSSTTLTTLPASWTSGPSFTTCPLSAYGQDTGSAFTAHGTNGSAVTDYWYDFSWDNF